MPARDQRQASSKRSPPARNFCAGVIRRACSMSSRSSWARSSGVGSMVARAAELEANCSVARLVMHPPCPPGSGGGDLLDRLAKRLHVDRLDQVSLKPGGLAFAAVAVPGEAADADAAERLAVAGADLAEEIDAAAVGELQVADQQVEGLAVGLAEGVAEGVGESHTIARAVQEPPKQRAGGGGGFGKQDILPV